MEQKQPNQMIAELRKFVEDNREDQFGPHESLYFEILKQWESLNRYSMSWADPQSKKLATDYWRGMASWYKKFDRQRDQVLEPQAFKNRELFNLFDQTANQMATDILLMLPDGQTKQPVVKINDFAFRLRNELLEFNQLNRDGLTPADFELLLEYWHELYQLVGLQDEEVK
ncbi:hypothetical protein [Limosilactobacillus avium]|uniref:hypothetical protein n=1 Tax=Limosilactobacillus avium TaxID=2991831 RepID=UPI0024BB3407|nr:hypothetical protein [Limosilactobacillus avium]